MKSFGAYSFIRFTQAPIAGTICGALRRARCPNHQSVRTVLKGRHGVERRVSSAVIAGRDTIRLTKSASSMAICPIFLYGEQCPVNELFEG